MNWSLLMREIPCDPPGFCIRGAVQRTTKSPLVWHAWRRGRSRFPRPGHESVEVGLVEIRGDGGWALFLVGGVHDSPESFGGVGGHWEKPEVIDNDEFVAEDSG